MWFNGVFKIDAITLGPPSSFTFKLTKRKVPYAGADGQTVTFAKVLNPLPVRLSWPVVQVITDANHGLIEGAVVALSGSDNPINPIATGEFVVLAPGASNSFYYLSPDATGTVPVGRVTCAEVIFLLDEILRQLPAYAVAHLCAGVFETRGFDPVRDSRLNWSVQPGQRIQGSGMGMPEALTPPP